MVGSIGGFIQGREHMRKMLDLLTDAATGFKVYGRRGIDDVYFSMTADERVTFDLWLVKTGDQLAQHAGTMESRFRCRALAMALNRPAVNSMGYMDLTDTREGA
jgi:exopolysaccharide biosynthesis protein